jgi:predicted transcriptional regulator of viral defense system
MTNPKSADFFATHPVFTHEEYLAARGAGADRSPRTADSLLTRHAAAGKILHVRRGLYAAVPPGRTPETFQVDPFLIASKLAPDATVGYHAALRLRGKACSESPRFAVLTRSNLRPLSFQGSELFGVRPPGALDGRADLGPGVTSEAHAGGRVRVTTLEHTLVDLLDCPELGGGWLEVWRSLELIEELDLRAVVGHALGLGSALTIARVGFFLEQHQFVLGVEEHQLAALRARAPRQPRYLDGKREPGRLVKQWNLVVPERMLDPAWTEPEREAASAEQLEAMAEIDRSEYVGLTFEQLDQVAATGAWSGDESFC